MPTSQEILEKREARTPESHAAEIAADFDVAVKKKYQIGQAEHGGRLWEKPVEAFTEEEVIDQWTYLHTAREQRALMKALLGEAIEEQNWDKVQKAFNVLVTGNIAGQKLTD